MMMIMSIRLMIFDKDQAGYIYAMDYGTLYKSV